MPPLDPPLDAGSSAPTSAASPRAWRRHAVTIAIALIAVGLGGYLLWFDAGSVTTGEATARKRNLLPAFRRAQITELTLEVRGETARIARRADDAGDAAYYLEGGELADPAAVDKVLGALEFATPERRVDEAIDRRAMGLDPPQARVTLAMGPVTYRLAVGGPAPAPKGAAYAALDGEPPCVIGRDLVTELTRPKDTYRGRTLVPYLSSHLASFSLEGAGDARKLVRGAWGGWAIEHEGRKVRVDRDVFDRVLTAFADLRAEAFTNDAEAEQALARAPSMVRLTLTPRETGAPRAVLEVGGECPGHPEDTVVLRSEPMPRKAACAPRGVLEPLSIPAARLLDRHVFSLRSDEMEEIALAAGSEKLDIVRAGPAWHMRAPADGKVDAEAGQGLAHTLQDLAAERLAKAEDMGTGAVRGAATLHKVDAGDDGGAVEAVEIGPEARGVAYVRRLADGAVLEMTSEAARALLPTRFALLSRKVIDLPANGVERVTIDAPPVRQVLHRSASGGWTLEEPRSLAVDPGLASDVAEALGQLRAERFVADADDGSFGLEAPRARYQIDGKEGTIRVETGRAALGGVFARRADRAEIFVLPDAARRALTTYAVDRSYFMIEPSEVRQIVLERGKQRLVLEPARDQAGAASTAAAERFEIARRALANARAEGLVHLGPARRDEGLSSPRLAITVARTPTAAAPEATIHIAIGRGDAYRDTSVFYARRAGVDGTFAIAQGKLRPLLDLL